MNLGANFYEKLDERINDMIARARDRAQNNGWKTIKARDA